MDAFNSAASTELEVGRGQTGTMVIVALAAITTLVVVQRPRPAEAPAEEAREAAPSEIGRAGRQRRRARRPA